MKSYDYRSRRKSIVYTISLGPLYLLFYFRSLRHTMPKSRYIFWSFLAAFSVCFYLSLTLSYHPGWIGVIYLAILLVTLATTFLFVREKRDNREPEAPHGDSGICVSRGIIWLFFLSFIFGNLSTLIQAANYWLIGEYITVFFFSKEHISAMWSFIGMAIGFIYGLRKENNYINADISSLLRSTLIIFILITLYSLITYLFVVYPLQRLSPISYFPQTAEFLFYTTGFMAIMTSSYFVLSRFSPHGIYKSLKAAALSVPLVLMHIILLSAYSTTLNLTVASIFEGKDKTETARKLYAKVVPFITHDPLQAALIHRQGTLSVINENYPEAISYFRKVVADYSEETFDAYGKAKKYIESYEKNGEHKDPGHELLKVEYTTFEQAASCFPNSLSLILNFYEADPIGTRELSYSIKESFNDGTFIWKAESFLDKRGYTLLTTFWQTKETLISLLEAKYPVLIYIPGHVYTLYGYDAGMEMFLTYDTAKYNRWDDKPFSEFQKSWMNSSFLMSVVIKKGEESTLRELAPELFKFSDLHKSWQKAQITDYYESKNSYWRDYDRYKIAEKMGISGLKLNDPTLHSNGFHTYPWDKENWDENIYPMLDRPWALEWRIFERFILYLLYNHQISEAKQLISLYRANLDKESLSVSNRILIIELAAEIAASNGSDISSEQLLTTSDKLIGQAEKLTGKTGYTGYTMEQFYWGYYIKGLHLLKKSDIGGTARLLLPLLNNFDLEARPLSKAWGKILEVLCVVSGREPSLIEPDMMAQLKIAWVLYNIEPHACR